jgi:hypothetical protein
MKAILVALVISAALLLAMVIEALAIGAVGAVFLDTGFWDGWHAAWNRPGYLLLFAIFARLGTNNDGGRR